MTRQPQRWRTTDLTKIILSLFASLCSALHLCVEIPLLQSLDPIETKKGIDVSFVDAPACVFAETR